MAVGKACYARQYSYSRLKKSELGCMTTSQPIYCLDGRKSANSRATQARCTDVPHWVTTSAVQPTFWDSDSFDIKCYGRQLAPSRCNLGRGSGWDVVAQPSPGHPPGVFLMKGKSVGGDYGWLEQDWLGLLWVRNTDTHKHTAQTTYTQHTTPQHNYRHAHTHRNT